jgi:L-asparaginase
LMRGNRTHKADTEGFDAIESANFPSLAEVGTHILYKRHLFTRAQGEFQVHLEMERNVAILKLFPGIAKEFVHRILGTPGLRGLILETYGSGNAPNKAWLHDMLSDSIQKGLVVVNVTQCNRGFVEQGKYGTSQGLQRCGVLSSADMTTEAALTKLMHLLSKSLSKEEVEIEFEKDLFGERTKYTKLV